jgi:hypothetical protein
LAAVTAHRYPVVIKQQQGQMTRPSYRLVPGVPAAAAAAATAQCSSSKPQRLQSVSNRAWFVLVMVACTTVLTVPAAAAEAEGRGVFAADSFSADLTLAVVKNRKAGPNHTVGPVPAGVAWDGKSGLFTRADVKSIALALCPLPPPMAQSLIHGLASDRVTAVVTMTEIL